MHQPLRATSLNANAGTDRLAMAILVGGVASGACMLLLSLAIIGWKLSTSEPTVVAQSPGDTPQIGDPASPGASPSDDEPAVPTPPSPPEPASDDPPESSGDDGTDDGGTSSNVAPPPTGARSDANPPQTAASDAGKVLPAVNLELELGEASDLLVLRPERIHGGPVLYPGGQMDVGPGERVDAAFGAAPAERYLVDARIQCPQGAGGVLFHLPLAGGTTDTTIAIDLPRQPHPLSGLMLVRGNVLDGSSRYPRGVLGGQLADGAAHDVRIAVLDRRIVVQFDGKTLVDWGGELARLGGFPHFRGAIGVSSLASKVRFERLRIYPITGYEVSPPAATVVDSEQLAGQNGSPPNVAPRAAGNAIAVNDLNLNVAATVDLLRLGATKHQGTFTRNGSSLLTGDGGICKLEFVYRLPESYVVDARLTRLNKTESIVFSLRVGGQACSFILDGWPTTGGPISGLQMIDGERAWGNPTRVAERQLENGKPADLRIAVVKNRVIAQLDGKTLVDWTGDPSRLSEDTTTHMTGENHHLAITTFGGRFQLDKLQVHRVTEGSSAASSVAGAGNLDVQVGEPVDLLKLGPMRRAGNFSTSGSSIVINGFCKLEYPHRLPESYVVESRLARMGGDNSISFSIRVDGQPCAVILDGWPERGSAVSGLDMIDGQRLNERSDVVRGSQLENGKPVDVRIVVAKNRVVAQLDGRTLFDWTGDPARLSESPMTRVGPSDSHHLGITVQPANYKIDKLLVYPISAAGGSVAASAGVPQDSGTAGDTSPATTAQTRHKIPEDADQKPVLDKMRAIFGDAIAKAKKPDERLKLARELYDAAKTEKDVVTRYVLLQAARKMAAAGLDVTLAFELSGLLGEQFEIDPLALQVESLQQASGAAGTTAEAHKQIAEKATELAEEMLDAERFDVADEASKAAYDAGVKSRVADLRRSTKELRDEVLAEKKGWDAAQAALQTLKTNAMDAAANLIVGKYYALARDDWPKALPYLAASGESALAAAAKAEQEAKDVPTQLAAADKWHEAAATAASGDKLAIQRHALEMYVALIPQLQGGLDQIKAEKHRDELQAAIEAAEKAESTASSRTRIRRKRRSGSLAPGLIVRTCRGEPWRYPTQAVSVVLSSDEYFGQAVEGVRNLVGNYSADYLQPVAAGFIVLPKDGVVELELMNCICKIGNTPLVANRSDTIKVQRKLDKGSHPVVFYRATENINSGPTFRAKLQGSDQNILFHSPQDLRVEVAKIIETINGNVGASVLVYRTPGK